MEDAADERGLPLRAFCVCVYCFLTWRVPSRTLCTCRASQYNAAVHYYDYENQRERFEAPDQIQVILYDVGKAMVVDNNNVCQYYCPVNDTLASGADYFSDPSAVDLGKVSYDGKVAELFQWNETLPILNLTMEYTNMYATADFVPLAQMTYLTPFGQQPPIETQTTTWTGFTVGVPPKAKFDVQGVAACPLDPQGCGQNSKTVRGLQRRRLTL